MFYEYLGFVWDTCNVLQNRSYLRVSNLFHTYNSDLYHGYTGFKQGRLLSEGLFSHHLYLNDSVLFILFLFSFS